MNHLVIKNFNAEIDAIDDLIEKLNIKRNVIQQSMYMAHELTRRLLNGRSKGQEVCNSSDEILDQVFSLTKEILNNEGFTLSFIESNKRMFVISMD
tara:strand:+ start:59 stop:346 length:288 start_codon:yes stop_codon:yes gene_type:complete